MPTLEHAWLKAKQNDECTTIQCPAHHDKKPSCSVYPYADKKTGEKRVGISCKSDAECTYWEIVEAAGWVETFDFHDENGISLHQTYRINFPDKTKYVRQRRYANGAWEWGLDGLQTVLYNLPAVRAADTVHLAEGEKCAQALINAGLVATTNPGGAEGWKARYANELAGKHIVVYEDNDDAGRKWVDAVCKSVRGRAASIKLINFRDERDKYDVADFLTAHAGKEGAVTALLDSAPEWEPPAPTSDLSDPYRLSSIADLIDRPLPAQLIEGLIQERSLNVVYGPPGTFKSFLVLDMLLSLATGLEFVRRKTKQTKTLYIIGEGEGMFVLRILAWLRHNGINIADADNFRVLPKALHLLNEQEIDAFIKSVLEQGFMPEVVAIDTLARNFGDGNENQAEHMNKFVYSADRFRSEFGAAVIVVHHANKEGDIRASTVLKGAADSVIKVTKDAKALIKVDSEKAKDMAEFPPMFFEPKAIDLDEANKDVINKDVINLEPRTSVVLLPAETTRPKRDESRLTPNQQKALDALVSTQKPLAFADWLRASDVSPTTFERAVKELATRGKVSKDDVSGLYAPA